MNSLWKRNILRCFAFGVTFPETSHVFDLKVFINANVSPEKLISQIRRCGKISFTSKEDFDLSGFSEIRCRI